MFALFAAIALAGFPTRYAPEALPLPDPGIGFNFSYGDDMVLQQAPAKACVTGTVNATATQVTLALSTGDATAYEVQATLRNGGDPGFKLWKACLKPQAAVSGQHFTLTASCQGCTAGSSTASLVRVVFGEVWYCGGQSNMALPLMHTLSRNESRDAILAGKYANMRIHGMSGNMNPAQPWSTLKNALATDSDSDKSAFGSFSSTCYYFGEQLSDELEAMSSNGQAPPIGLVHTAWGGSMIEQWLSNETIATCTNASISAANQEWHDQRVLPYVDMTIKGWVWYQAENNMHGFFGNSAKKSGYSCLAQALVEEWRRLWSAEPGTTSPDAPFGLVTLAPSGTEGGASIGTMRWAQTAGYGVTPNAALPNVFTAQAFDLNDPYANISCYGKTKCHDNTPWNMSWPPTCHGYCDSVRTSNFYMGPIHPRDKRPVGKRLGQQGAVAAYGKPGHITGPTLSGCAVEDNKITLRFNKTLLAGRGAAADAIKIQPYYDGSAVVGGKAYNEVGSKMQVLLNASLFCMQLGGRGGQPCRDDGTGVGFNTSFDDNTVWKTVNIVSGANPNEVVVDLARTNGTAFAIRYGWTGDCCSENPPSSEPCSPASCPIVGTTSALPANPFIAKIVNGKCQCVVPQKCDGDN